MKKITLEQLNKIEEINGTLATRYEYIDAIAEILNKGYGGVRWNVNTMKTISMDDKHILDITTKTVKGQRFLVGMTVYGGEEFMSLNLLRKKGVWICTYDKDWFSNGAWVDGAEQMQGQPYRG